MIKKTGFIFIALVLIAASKLFSQDVIDSLENQLKTNLTPSEKVAILSELCWQYRQIDQSKGLRYGNDAVKLARESADKKGLSKSLNDLSILYIDKTQLDTAILLLNQALAIRIELKDSVGEAAIYNKLGIIYQNQLNLKEALTNALKALDLYEALKMSPNIQTTMNNIGVIHYNLRNLDQSLAIHSQLMELRNKAGNQYGMGQSMLNIGNVYVAKGDTLKGMDYYKKAASIFRTLDKKEELAVVLNNLGSHHNQRMEYKEARSSLEESLAIRRMLNKPKDIGSVLGLLGELNLLTKNYKQARSNFQEALTISKQFDLPQERLLYQKLALMYSQLNKADSVYYYYSQYDLINNTLYEENIRNEVAELQTRYDTQKKENKIKLLQQENELKESRLQRNQLFVSLLVIAIAALVLFGFLWRNRFMLKQKVELESTKATLRESQLQAVISSQEEERKRFAEDLHDGMGQLISAVKLNLSKEDVEKNALNHAVEVLNEMNAEIRNIAFNLMPQVLIKGGLEEALTELAYRVNNTGKVQISISAFDLEEEMPPDRKVALYRVCQEWINNVIKYSACTKIEVQLVQHTDELVITIEDDGHGFDASILATSTGNGWRNINSRLTLVHGQIDIDSSTSRQGTTVTISVPPLVASVAA